MSRVPAPPRGRTPSLPARLAWGSGRHWRRREQQLREEEIDLELSSVSEQYTQIGFMPREIEAGRCLVRAAQIEAVTQGDNQPLGHLILRLHHHREVGIVSR